MATASRSSTSMFTRSHASRLRPFAYLGITNGARAAVLPVKDFLRTEASDVKIMSFWSENLPYIIAAVVLILLGGAFAGLTIALMGQDGVYLEVIATSGEGKERVHADKVRRLLARGKHWVLVTLLLANVIVNETLPVILDRMGGGGWVAVLLSTTAIVIFGEIIPQSICVRYGMGIGAAMAPYTYVLMLLLSPIGYPIAKLLDFLLGHDHGTTYKKTGLKTLVDLHRTMGEDADARLNHDEVTIIKAVLDLKEKSVNDIMTPMDDVYTMSADTVLDDETISEILSAGYSRIPIYQPGSPLNFVGMLLVKILITYDPEDCKKVSEFALATLPETRPETSCLDIINFFQEGKSHMVLVSEYPGEDYGAIGVVTLEDVIEELIGEEIIDESDVYIDVHKAIRRLAPAPHARMHKEASPKRAGAKSNDDTDLIDISDERAPTAADALMSKSKNSTGSNNLSRVSSSPKTTFLMRRSSNGTDGNAKDPPLSVRGNIGDMREHLKHLGPSNLASRPTPSRYQSVKIKPGYPAVAIPTNSENKTQPSPIVEERYTDFPGGEGEGLITAGKDASDGALAVHQGYGTTDGRSPLSPRKQLVTFGEPPESSGLQRERTNESNSSDTLGDLRSGDGTSGRKKSVARSGSITENIVDVGGVRKVILETTSESDGENGESKGKENVVEDTEGQANDGEAKGEGSKKSKRRRKRKGGKADDE